MESVNTITNLKPMTNRIARRMVNEVKNIVINLRLIHHHVCTSGTVTTTTILLYRNIS